MGLDRAVLFRLATSPRFEGAVRALPGGERLSWSAASRYVAGRGRAEALAATGRLLSAGRGVSVDL
ncbi:MAG TPA: hypothetical protein VER97_18200, partial [Geodermatophilus sp.]|nr:hypothetical protein [Geodermatophilus sp.]